MSETLSTFPLKRRNFSENSMRRRLTAFLMVLSSTIAGPQSIRARNLNSGEDPATGIRMEIAQQTVYHDPQYPSHVVLPLIPRGGETSARRTNP